MEDFDFYLTMWRNIIFTFFHDGIWVVGFFYLLVKTFDSKRILTLAKVILTIALIILFFHAIQLNR